MKDYAQPDFYRFNEDSLKLVHFVAARLNRATSILDLGAGCGVIGIELARRLAPGKLSLLELQPDWKSYLERNVKTFLEPRIEIAIHIAAFGAWASDEKFDLIVSNPPYYLPGHGQRSLDDRKHFARTFERDSWEVLLELISCHLSGEGEAYIILKDDRRILKKVKSEKLQITSEKRDGLAYVRLTH